MALSIDPQSAVLKDIDTTGRASIYRGLLDLPMGHMKEFGMIAAAGHETCLCGRIPSVGCRRDCTETGHSWKGLGERYTPWRAKHFRDVRRRTRRLVRQLRQVDHRSRLPLQALVFVCVNFAVVRATAKVESSNPRNVSISTSATSAVRSIGRNTRRGPTEVRGDSVEAL